jgi:hypothetical protein
MIINARALGIFKILSDCRTGMNEDKHGSLLSGYPVAIAFDVIASEIGVN